jgi:endoglucanase
MSTAAAAARALSDPSPAKLPRWRGFNLLEKFMTGHFKGRFLESDFDVIAEWGFDFVRLPCSYWFWSKPEPDKWLEIDEGPIRDIDGAIEMGRARGIHVNLNLHRAPGFCVSAVPEPLSLWDDERALEACAHHWRFFAGRYKGIPSTQLSFNLLNEPPDIDEARYLKVHTRLIAAIREVDPDRLIIADGLRWGNAPVAGLVGQRVGISTRGYTPMQVSHYRANWVKGSDAWPAPTWPLAAPEHWDKARLRRERIEPFKKLEAAGVGVHVGEWGAHQNTPHDVALAWMADCLDLWRDAGWGWALWNLRGSFGVMDSGRSDVLYEAFRGHKLDRKMLELIRSG